MRTDPALFLLLGLPFWILLPVAARNDMAEGAALVALGWSILLLAGLFFRVLKGRLPAMALAAVLVPLPFLPLPVALTLSAVLLILCAWYGGAGFRRWNAVAAAVSVPPLIAFSASVVS